VAFVSSWEHFCWAEAQEVDGEIEKALLAAIGIDCNEWDYRRNCPDTDEEFVLAEVGQLRSIFRDLEIDLATGFAAFRNLVDAGLVIWCFGIVTAMPERKVPRDDLWGWRRAVKDPCDPLSPIERLAIYERDGRVCAYCDTTEGPFNIDHKEPRSRGGTNNPANLCVACRACNLAKKAKPYAVWLNLIGRLDLENVE
jgi:hypothetical protein